MNENQTSGSPLRAVNVTIAYRSVPVLQNVNFEAPAGTLTAIVGPNGAGKSTLIKASLGLIEPASGHFEFFGKSFREAVGRVSYVPQRTSVDWDFPVTALDVVCMGLYRKIGWLLIIPASAARYWSDSIRPNIWISGGIGALSAGLGSMASAMVPRLSTGAIIVVVAALLLAVSVLVGRQHGLIFRWREMSRLKNQDLTH